MAERSQFWSTGTTGDGTTTITEAQAIEWFRDIMIPFASAGPNTAQGVLFGVLGELAVTGATSPVAVAAGAAVVEGYYYKNDASVNVAIPTPAGSTRIDRIVLRAQHGVTRTVRITRIAGIEGAGAPAITQTAGTTWDIPLAQVSITTGGAITLTDQRTFAYFATKVKTSMLDDLAIATGKIADDAVTNAKLRNSAAVSVIGRSVNSAGDPADIAAGANETVLMRTGDVVQFAALATAQLPNNGVTDAKLRDSAALSVIGRSANSTGDPADIAAVAASGAVLRESGSTIGFGQVATAGIANDAVDDTKAGNRVPMFTRRIGGASDWGSAGAEATATPTAVKMQGGTGAIALAGTSVDKVVTFPQAFSATPFVLVSLNSGVTDQIAVRVNTITTTQVTFTFYSTDTTAMSGTGQLHWLAVGPE
jgi:hypothetical protein